MTLQQFSDIYSFYSNLRLAVRTIERNFRDRDEAGIKAQIACWVEEKQKRKEFGGIIRQEGAHVIDELSRNTLMTFKGRIRNMEQNLHLILLQMEAGAGAQRQAAADKRGAAPAASLPS